MGDLAKELSIQLQKLYACRKCMGKSTLGVYKG